MPRPQSSGKRYGIKARLWRGGACAHNPVTEDALMLRRSDFTYRPPLQVKRVPICACGAFFMLN
jgi:hypothetical protein